MPDSLAKQLAQLVAQLGSRARAHHRQHHAAHGGTDTYDVTNVKIYRDSNGNGVLDGTEGSATISYLDEIAADATAYVIVVADVPLGLANNAVSGVTLTATGREGGGGPLR